MPGTPEQFSSFSTKTKCVFFIFHLFFCQKVSDKLLTFWLVCLLSNPCYSWLVFNMLRAVIYACAHACVCVTACVYVHLCVCYCWSCCCRNILWSELCDILPCCWIRWQAECISSARRCHSVFCRLSATSALSLYSDWSHGLTSKFGSSSAAPSFATWAPTLLVSKIREAERKL